MELVNLPAEKIHVKGNSIVTNEDNMQMMSRYPDGFFDLAIIDPPYGIGEDGSRNKSRSKKTNFGKKNTRKTVVNAKDYKPYSGNDSNSPSVDFFLELFRVSKKQIIFGANHFISKIPYDSSCWIIWDKINGESDFADVELAWTSFKSASRKFSFRWSGMLQGNMIRKQHRIHPNEKPFELYSWILEKYAKEGDKILDTHLGSQSSRIAAYKKGFDFYGCELDPDYFKSGYERFEKEISMPLFDQEQENNLILKLF